MATMQNSDVVATQCNILKFGMEKIFENVY
jgi:hypothetical protein